MHLQLSDGKLVLYREQETTWPSVSGFFSHWAALVKAWYVWLRSQQPNGKRSKLAMTHHDHKSAQRLRIDGELFSNVCHRSCYSSLWTIRRRSDLWCFCFPGFSERPEQLCRNVELWILLRLRRREQHHRGRCIWDDHGVQLRRKRDAHLACHLRMWAQPNWRQLQRRRRACGSGTRELLAT